MLILSGILIPVTYTDANGLPLGGETDRAYRKILLSDTGLMLRLLNMSISDISQITTRILADSAAELVNKGPMAEQMAGLELLRYQRSPYTARLVLLVAASQKLAGGNRLYSESPTKHMAD